MRLLAIGSFLLLGLPLQAQERASGTYIVTRSGGEVGREEFTLEPGARDRSGSTLTVSSTYPAATRGGKVGVRLERTADGQLSLFQLDAEGDAGQTTIFAAGAGARVILRTKTQGSEAGREVPGGPNVVLLDENVHALYLAVAALATPAGTRMTAIYPRTGRRAQLLARREGDAGAGARITLSGEISGTLTLGAGEYPTRMEFPGSGTTVTLAER
jgi:hypothetical protein